MMLLPFTGEPAVHHIRKSGLIFVSLDLWLALNLHIQ